MSISVCLAAYNGAKYIKEQVSSVLQQLGKDDEIVVSDDGSTDDTIAILESFQDTRIKIYRNEGRHGFIWNFENALKKSVGDVVFLCDQDDIWKPEKVTVVTKALEDCDIVLHDAELIDKTGNRMGVLYSERLHKGRGFWCNLWKTRWLGCCIAFRRSVLDYSLPFPRHIVGHDGWISSIGLAVFKYDYIPDTLIYYRRHDQNATASSEKSTNSLYFMLVQKRLWTLIEVSRRVFRRKILQK